MVMHPDTKKIDEPPGYEDTVVVEPMAVKSDGAENNDISVDNETDESLKYGKSGVYEQTISLDQAGVARKAESRAATSDDTIVVSEEEIGVRSGDALKPYSATDLEKKYFQASVGSDGVDEKYKLQEKLVSGGMGSILKVFDQHLRRTTAMKVLLPSLKGDESTLNDFIREAQITGILEHPNIIPVHELGLLPNMGLFFTMKLAHGEALNQVIKELKKKNPLYVEKYNLYNLLRIIRKVCDAISYAHSFDIIHQDIKPHNMMVGQFGEVLLMDWGVARYIGDPKNESDPARREILEDILKSSQQDEDLIKGSPTYMSPEQTKGDPRLLDKQTDIFLLGATMYHLFTFETPYKGNDVYEIIHKAEKRDLIDPQERNPRAQIPEELSRIILKAMAFEKAQRYQTIEEISSDIDALMSGKWMKQEKMVFEKGQLLMAEGETGEEAYLIMEGRVEVYKRIKDTKVRLGVLETGSIVGEMALITKEARSASVAALEKTEAAVLTQHLLSENLKKLPPFMEKIISALTERLQKANEMVNPHLTEDCTYIVLKQLRMLFRDRSNNMIRNFKFPINELIDEIAEDLGIPHVKVKAAMLKALKLRLIVLKKKNVMIPDIEELSQFTRLAKTIVRRTLPT